MCGGTLSPVFRTGIVSGLSPRVRGNLALLIPVLPQPGPIPACAGEPLRAISDPTHRWAYPRVCGGTRIRSSNQSRIRAYPRVCGGTVNAQKTCVFCQGLSPRVRGNLQAANGCPICRGPIPACAGEPHPVTGTAYLVGAYPRVCGGTPGG